MHHHTCKTRAEMLLFTFQLDLRAKLANIEAKLHISKISIDNLSVGAVGAILVDDYSPLFLQKGMRRERSC